MEKVLIVGGGAAGMAAALELSRRGVASVLVERDSLGGLSNDLACKGSPRCVRCDACYPRDLRAELRETPGVQVVCRANVVRLDGSLGGFTAAVSDASGAESEISVGAVIVATGARPYDAALDPRLHYGDCPGILTSRDVDLALVERGAMHQPGEAAPKDMAVIQCVGSRDQTRGMPYCSKACCKYAFKLARHLRSLYPELRVTFFYMDWRPLDDGPSALTEWASGDDRVRLVRSRPAEVLPGPRPVVRYAAEGEYVAEEAFDLVMLTVGLVPSPDNAGLAASLGIKVDELGFLRSDRAGIIVAGCCRSPMDIRQSVEEGIAAAGAAAALLGGRP